MMPSKVLNKVLNTCSGLSAPFVKNETSENKNAKAIKINSVTLDVLCTRRL